MRNKPRVEIVKSLTQKCVDNHVGMKLRLLRLSHGMSQQMLSEKIGVTFQQLQKYEKGMNRISAGRLYFLAKVLGVSVDHFFLGLPGYDVNESSSFTQMEYDLLSKKDSLNILKSINSLEDGDVKNSLKTLIKSLKS